MTKPTIISSGPDAMGRTVCQNEALRRAQYGRIRPMNERRSIGRILERLNPLG